MKPRFSIIMPVYNPNPEHLSQALNSVLAQNYPHWELCIADDASSDPAVADILDDYARRDARIKVKRRKVNGHICAASNTALGMALGDYAVFMDHDDLLVGEALALVALALDREPRTRILYSDEDKFNENGIFFSPYFKPAFDPDLLCGQNYFNHLSVYDITLLRQVGGLRPGFEGAQDHDLALRCVNLVSPDEIMHLPYILYHWRLHDKSTANSPQAKNYAADAGLRAVGEHLEGLGRKVLVNKHVRCATHYQVRPLVGQTRVSLLAFCQNLPPRFDMWASIVMKKSAKADLSLHIFHDQEATTRSRNAAVYCAPFDPEAVQDLVQSLSGSIIGCLGLGLLPFETDWLDMLAAEAGRPEVGAVGARIWSQNRVLENAGFGITRKGRIFADHEGLAFHKLPYFNQPHLLHATAFLSADCLFARAEVFSRLFRPETNRLWPLEFCMLARANGLRVICSPEADLYRMSGYEPHSPPQPEDADMAAFLARWQEELPQIMLHSALTPVPGGYRQDDLRPEEA
ncbi:glycosyltransferase [Desulfovibrio sp. OttesenSCG-928-F20]|nr:glycosyltransferase [Desulfovibrio sp. OttesenSCG-928-F20]